MTDLLRRFRGVGVALVVLAMSAGVALATSPHLQPASNTSPNAETPTDGADEDADDGDQGTETPEAPEAADEDATDATDTEEAPNPDSHGALVSAAAKMQTPAGFRNHGAFVSCVAHLKDATAATIDWTTITPEACAAAKPGKSGDAGATGKANSDAKRAAHAAAKAERAADKAAREAARAAAKAAREAAKGH